MALRRVRPAASVVVWQVAARLHSFTWAGRRYTVEEVYGPWRRSGSWWTPEVWSSEEWDVRASSAEGETLLCVMRNDLLRRDWRLEALYD
jgi:protein ImuB